jgi:hypothetical protein
MPSRSDHSAPWLDNQPIGVNPLENVDVPARRRGAGDARSGELDHLEVPGRRCPVGKKVAIIRPIEPREVALRGGGLAKLGDVDVEVEQALQHLVARVSPGRRSRGERRSHAVVERPHQSPDRRNRAGARPGAPPLEGVARGAAGECEEEGVVVADVSGDGRERICVQHVH